MSNPVSARPGALANVGGGALMLAVALAAAHTMAALALVPAVAGFALYLAAGAVVMTGVGRFPVASRFGLANTLTLIRLVVTCFLAAFAVEFCRSGAADDAIMWRLFAVAIFALIVDGLDGFTARRLGQTSDFGARFDMEVDALLILVLSVTALAVGKAGPWVLASGLLRYLYVGAALVVPALTRPLAPAWRRKVIAVIQGGALTVLLTPAIQPPLSAVVAATALVLLVYSFGVDILAQVRAP